MIRASKITPAEALERLQRDIIIDPVTGCWLWQGAKTQGGYGTVTLKGEKWGTHRMAYHFFVGWLPRDTVVHHKCGVRGCCNPDHLQATSHHHNGAEMMARTRLEQELAEAQARVEQLSAILEIHQQ